MRNFLRRNPFRKDNKNNSKNLFIPEILDTDEDRVTNQYEVYRNFIKKIKREFLQGSKNLMGYKRNMAAQ